MGRGGEGGGSEQTLLKKSGHFAKHLRLCSSSLALQTQTGFSTTRTGFKAHTEARNSLMPYIVDTPSSEGVEEPDVKATAVTMMATTAHEQKGGEGLV